ncbi:PREDICTED: uncharacterized protein LOC105126089 isoform X4 [Populus euphratica]|nr:PREDICTED: uncharacterized protein LOC105126089 isoform X4 [Populus euphratica]
MMEKEKEKKSQGAGDTDFVLQWGSTKRLRCVKVKKAQNLANKSKLNDSLPRKKLASRAVTTEKEFPSRLMKKSSALSPEREERYYTTRGSLGLDDNSKILVDTVKEEKVVWPRLFITLSNKEKEEDFMAMKGCKPSQRPKKRAKLIQRTLLMASPGAWLSDLCQERYEVREKKTSKKRPRGLKAMGSMESDSE